MVYNNRVFGKPKNKGQAAAFLAKLSGKKHTVVSCVAVKVKLGNFIQTFHRQAKTTVRFRKLSPFEIAEYVATPEPYDKAGAYGIQEKGKIFVQSVCGCYYNVMGLPLQELLELLNRANRLVKIKKINYKNKRKRGEVQC